MASLFSEDDYPVSALRDDEEGPVSVVLDVTTDGRVGACHVQQSSGSQSLDDATCSIMQRRARFTPARDQYGKLIVDHYRQRVLWQLPRDPYQALTERFVVRYDARGEIVECRMEAADADQPPCAPIGQLIELIRAGMNDTTTLNGRTMTVEHRVEIDGSPWRPGAIPAGGTVTWQQVAEYRLRPDGKVAECRLVFGNASALKADLCQNPFDGPYEIDNKRTYRPLRTTVALYSTP